ncbi:MAG TPA: methyltransferase domain-containing protein [Chitinophagaceae bacterium]
MTYNKYEHFQLERQLANKLRDTTTEQRRVLYGKLYNDLFSTFPGIPEGLSYSKDDRLAWQLKLMKPLFNKEKVVLEIGAGDCLVSKELAKHFKKIIAYEVADSIPFIEGKPANFELKIFNGIDMHESENSVDVVYSNQVFEHLHPDDTQPLLRAYHSYLTKGGKLVVITPHLLTGPHDISRDFTRDPEGFHLKEYTYKEMKAVLTATGFKKIKGYVGYSKLGYFSLPISTLIAAEKAYNLFPAGLKRKLRSNSVVFNLFGMKIIAEK